MESFNATWTDGLERRPSLYDVLSGFIRKESGSETELREECLAVGVNNVDKNKDRKRRESEKRKDLKVLCSNFASMPIDLYLDSIVSYLKSS